MSEIDLASYYEEVVKTAGLKADDSEPSEEKIAAVVAVTEQFDIDGIEFEDEDEKIAAAVAIVDGFESATSEDEEKDAGVKELYSKVKGHIAKGYGKTKEKARAGYERAKAHLREHKGKYIAGGAAGAGGLGLGYAAGRRNRK